MSSRSPSPVLRSAEMPMAMMAFDQVFPDVAQQESCVIQTHHGGELATLLLREFYCGEPRCDCRCVVLHVHWVEERRIVASIRYAFERPRRRNEPQVALEPLNPQSEYSDSLLALFTDMVGTDRAYRERLIQHYTAWRQVVDDASHPGHGKARRAAHDDPSFRPAVPPREAAARAPRAKRDRAGGSQSLQRVAAKAREADSKLQREFRRRLGKVDRLKQQVRAWKEARPAIDTEVSRYAARMAQLRGLDRAMVELLDRSYGDAAFSKADRKKLGALICELAGELIAEGGHDDLKPLYNRYSRSDFDVEATAADAASAAALRSMMETFGVEFGDADVSSLDKLEAFTQDQMRAADEEEAAEQARRATRKKSAKQRAAEARREAEQRSTGKALQDVYRALAKALHPDREQDPAEQVRKTGLMREVNVAYEAKDLLRLLELQLELERVEPAQADAIAEERLRHYIRILDEQARQLAAELEELELPFRIELGREPTAPLPPAEVVAQIVADTSSVTRQIAALERDVAAFQDVNRIKAWLRTRPGRGRRDRAADVDLFG